MTDRENSLAGVLDDDPAEGAACASCGYDLHGLDDDAPCPECGATERWLGVARGTEPAGSARVAFVFGALSVVTSLSVIGGVLFGVAAVVIGLRAERAARRLAGVWLGVLGLVLTAAWLVSMVGWLFVV